MLASSMVFAQPNTNSRRSGRQARQQVRSSND
jgi:hypothetical protein